MRRPDFHQKGHRPLKGAFSSPFLALKTVAKLGAYGRGKAGMAERFERTLTAPRADQSDQATPAQQFREGEKRPQPKPLSFSQLPTLIGEVAAALISVLQ